GVDYLVRDGDEFRKTFSTEPDDVVINVTAPLLFDGSNRRMKFSSARGTDTARLVLVDLETGDEEVVHEHPTRDLQWRSLRFHQETYEPQLLAYATDQFEYVVVDESVRGDIDAIRTQTTGAIHVSS